MNSNIDYQKNPSVKIWSNKFQMVMINDSKVCASLKGNVMSEK